MSHVNQKIDAFIKSHSLIDQGSTIVIGLSGGPDSLFLLHLLAGLTQKYSLKLVAAHLDHQWRADSTRDLLFCAEQAESYGIPFEHRTMSELKPTIPFTGTKEEQGRAARRHFLEQVAQQYNANTIALGHHLQDQEETFFIRLIRGTTISGLCGIWPRRGLYIRPLLETSKNDIIAYLQEHNLPYIIDPSNELESFLRNRIRSSVIPALQSCDDRFDANFLRTVYSLQETELFLQRITQQIYVRISTKADGTTHLSIDHLLEQEPYLQQRIILHWLIEHRVPFVPTKKFLQEILRFMQQPESKEHALHGTWSLIKKKRYIWIKQKPRDPQV